MHGTAVRYPPPSLGEVKWKTEQWAFDAKSGTQYLVSDNRTSPFINDIYFYTPFFYLQTGKQYKFKYYTKSGTTVEADAPRVSAYIGNAQTSSAMTTGLYSFFQLNFIDYQLGETVFNVTSTGNYCIGFRMRSKYSGYPASQIQVYIDDISLEDVTNLPVTMTPLKSIVTNGQTQLIWQTLTEQNNKGFTIESSTDGQHFLSVAYIPSLANNGNSIMPISYNYNLPSNNINSFYRIKQEDKNGISSYSNILKITAIADKPTVAFESNKKRLNVFSPQLQKLRLTLLNAQGKTVLNKTVSVSTGFSQQPLDMLSIEHGIYFLQSNFEKGNNPLPIKIIL